MDRPDTYPIVDYYILSLRVRFYKFFLPSSLCFNDAQKRHVNDDDRVVAYDPRCHQGMTPRCQRSRHPRASSPHDSRRRRMSSFTRPLEDLVSLRSELARMNLPSFLVLNFIGPHVFNGPSFISISPLCGSLIICMIILSFRVVGL